MSDFIMDCFITVHSLMEGRKRAYFSSHAPVISRNKKYETINIGKKRTSFFLYLNSKKKQKIIINNEHPLGTSHPQDFQLQQGDNVYFPTYVPPAG